MQRLQGRIALITGSARGIGEATARRFAAEGATVVISDIDEERGRAVAADLRATFLKLDVARDEDWVAALQALNGRVDILVNNAGITGFAEGVVPQVHLVDAAPALEGAVLGAPAASREWQPSSPTRRCADSALRKKWPPQSRTSLPTRRAT